MHAFIEFQLPFCLYLKREAYRLYLPEEDTTSEPFVLLLNKHHRQPEEIDFESMWGAEKIAKGELWQDKHGIFRRSIVRVILPRSIPLSSNPARIDKNAADTDPYFEIFPHSDLALIENISLAAINRLLDVYRFVTQDVYIPKNIRMEDISNTFYVGVCTVAEGRVSDYLCQQIGRDARLVNTLPDYDSQIHSQIRRLLTTNQRVPLFEELIMNAKSFFDENNYRMAVIEIQTAFEVFAQTETHRYYEENPATPSVDAYTLNPKRLMKHLEIGLGKDFRPGQIWYDQWLTDAYELRNRVVHRGHAPTRQEAFSSIRAVELALEYLIGQTRHQIWPKEPPALNIDEFAENISELSFEGIHITPDGIRFDPVADGQ